MTIHDMWNTVISSPGFKTALVIIILSVVEICPIKINPWSWVGGLIGKLLGIKAVSDKIDALELKVNENHATAIRVRILTFEDRLQSGENPSKDSWNQVMDDINRYETYTEKHREFKNNITITTIEHLKKEYARLLEERAWTTTLTNVS